MTLSDFQPYCGAPPAPGGTQWNLDPILIVVLVIAAGFYAAWVWSRSITIDGRPALAGVVGFTVLAAALISPLCNLSIALFAARAAQHVLMLLVAAPLLMLGVPRGRIGRFEAFAGPLGFAAILWFWHSPAFYDATLENNEVYWVMHVSLFGSSLILWRVILDERAGNLLASLFTGAQMCALGTMLTLSPRAWFSVHAATTWPWGLSQSADQQLGGVIMWVVGGILISVFTVASLARMLKDSTPMRITS